jgi:hypothetical protein
VLTRPPVEAKLENRVFGLGEKTKVNTPRNPPSPQLKSQIPPQKPRRYNQKHH